MRRAHPILVFLGLLIAAGWLSHFVSAEPAPSGLACASSRVTSFGWTHRDRALAEMAAILRWQDEARAEGAPFGAWHQARNRHLTCRVVGGPGGHFQCSSSATPCRPASGGAPG